MATALPQKKYYRQRAHSNPLSDHTFNYPISPKHMNWSTYYGSLDNPAPMLQTAEYPLDQALDNSSSSPETEHSSHQKCPVDFVDIGCGYGGLLVTLSTMFPDKRILGLEIRVKVFDYVQDKIKALRAQHSGSYTNIAILRTNAMKYLPNYFEKHQLSKMFFLFPDPHFKKSKHKWRVISPSLLAEYAYCLKIGGLVYTATDVEDLHKWMREHFIAHPLFEEITKEEKANDAIVPLLPSSTEEGKKVQRAGNPVYVCVFRRVHDHCICSH